MTSPASVALLLLALQAAAQASPTEGPAMTAEDAELFLKSAKVLELSHFDTKGVTMPRKATLDDGDRRLHAIFKDVDEYKPIERLQGGEVVMQFRDSYRSEIAAYELDKMLGLGIVPPCVQRRVGSNIGALCLWVEGTMTEWQRRMEKEIDPPDPVAWNNQMSTIKLFQQLIFDIDYKNISNLLIDADFKIYKVDSSRAFRTDTELRNEQVLTRFSRSFLEGLEGLTKDKANSQLKQWLTKAQIKGLIARRDRILELAKERVAAQGEAAVLYP